MFLGVSRVACTGVKLPLCSYKRKVIFCFMLSHILLGWSLPILLWVDKCISLLQNDSMAKTSEGKSSHSVTKPATRVTKSLTFEKFVPMLLIVTIGLAFLVGMLWQKVNNLEGGSSVGTTKVADAPTNNAPEAVSGKLTGELAGKVPGISDSDYVLGNRDAEVVLIEYSDLECPFCERFHPTGKQAVEEYGDKIAWVYRHFPLETIHPRALPGAVASECVGKEAGSEGFWQFIDMVFTDQTKYLTDEGLRKAAIASGANGDSFDSCFSSNEFEGKVREMATKASEAGVTGTPATYVVNKNGDTWLVPGAVPFESLKATIDEALGK